ncbi:MAG: transglycosylase domain-containing protein [Actinomycetota bacterium]
MAQNAAYLPIWRRPLRRPLSRGQILLASVLGTLLVGVVVIGLVLAQFAGPWARALTERAGKVGTLAANPAGMDARSKVYSSDGKLLAILHGEENREPIPLSAMPWPVQNAVIAIEDQRFASHDGVDLSALGRALFVNATGGAIEQGGGTITMQLARNAYLHNRTKTLERKWDEIVLARRLEATMTKDQILEEYLNTVYFGRGAYGIQAAAEAFFDKPAWHLTLGEAALLAGFIRAPQNYDPVARPEQAFGRRAAVLAAMQRNGMIDIAQRVAAEKEKLRFASRTSSNGIVMVTPYGGAFVEYVKQSLLADPRLGATLQERTDRLFNGGLRIQTTLDAVAQRAAEKTIAEILDRKDDPSAALASVDPNTGAIRAMAGEVDAQGFNLAAQGRRQPGSAFKPFTLVAALEEGFSLYDGYSGSAPRNITLDNGQVWTVHNYEGSAGGYMNLIRATELSVNAVYAQLVMDVGPDKVVSAAQRMGITSPLDPYPSITLGGLTIGVSPLEMASAYGTLAAKGMAHRPYAVMRVVDGDAEVLANEPHPVRALEPEVANKATAVLERVVLNGTGKRAQALGAPGGGQDGNDRRLPRLLVRRIHAAALHVGLDRLSEGSDPFAQHPRTASRVRGQPAGRDLDAVHDGRARGRAGAGLPRRLAGRWVELLAGPPAGGRTEPRRAAVVGLLEAEGSLPEALSDTVREPLRLHESGKNRC